jgi:hypothetical protein
VDEEQVDSAEAIDCQDAERRERHSEGKRIFLAGACDHSERDANPGRKVHVGRHRAARGHEADIEHLDGSAHDDAGLHIAQDEADDHAGDERPADRIPAGKAADEDRRIDRSHPSEECKKKCLEECHTMPP